MGRKNIPGNPDSKSSEPGQGGFLNRRKFFKFLGGGLAVVFVSQDFMTLSSPVDPLNTPSNIPVDQIGAWIHIGENGIISVLPER